jgi:hypothetical protein
MGLIFREIYFKEPMEKVATGTEMQIVEVEHIDCNKRATIKNREINS